jgi:hypothetical protein
MALPAYGADPNNPYARGTTRGAVSGRRAFVPFLSERFAGQVTNGSEKDNRDEVVAIRRGLDRRITGARWLRGAASPNSPSREPLGSTGRDKPSERRLS